jgi:hypothetical protein
MGQESEDPSRARPSGEQPEPLDRDEKVKLDLPFEQALRALLETQPEPEPSNEPRPKKGARSQ